MLVTRWQEESQNYHAEILCLGEANDAMQDLDWVMKIISEPDCEFGCNDNEGHPKQYCKFNKDKCRKYMETDCREKYNRE